MDLCYVAAGWLDGYWELNLKEWDVCAGELIAQEAGAAVKRYRNDHGICILAACPGIAPQLLNLIEWVYINEKTLNVNPKNLKLYSTFALTFYYNDR